MPLSLQAWQKVTALPTERACREGAEEALPYLPLPHTASPCALLPAVPTREEAWKPSSAQDERSKKTLIFSSDISEFHLLRGRGFCQLGKQNPRVINTFL